MLRIKATETHQRRCKGTKKIRHKHHLMHWNIILPPFNLSHLHVKYHPFQKTANCISLKWKNKGLKSCPSTFNSFIFFVFSFSYSFILKKMCIFAHCKSKENTNMVNEERATKWLGIVAEDLSVAEDLYIGCMLHSCAIRLWRRCWWLIGAYVEMTIPLSFMTISE